VVVSSVTADYSSPRLVSFDLHTAASSPSYGYLVMYFDTPVNASSLVTSKARGGDDDDGDGDDDDDGGEGARPMSSAMVLVFRVHWGALMIHTVSETLCD
jgi:hypothetical protein